MRSKTHFILAFGLILTLILTACAGVGADKATPTTEATATIPPAPTATPTPPPPLLVMLAPQGSDPAMINSLQPVLEAAGKENGLQFSLRQSLSEAELQQENIRLAVILSPGIDPLGLATAAPQTQFLAVGFEGVEPQENLSLIEAHPYRPDWEGFAAGYIAAVVTADWRTAVVADAGTIEGKAAQNAFINGVRFMCGLCQPLYPPFPIPTYPLTGQLGSGATQQEIDSVTAYFKEWGVKTVYLYRPSESWISAFGAAGFNLIADSPPPPGMESQWVVSLESGNLSEEVNALLPSLLAGKGGQMRSVTLNLTHPNAQIFTPGKQDFVDEMLQDLLAGFIDTGIDPTTGEFR